MSLSGLEISDAHHHLWSLSEGNYPWLSKGGVKRVAGDYTAIQRDYLLDDFKRDIGPLLVTSSVHVEAGYERAECVDETKWLQAVADSAGFPQAIVAYCDLGRADAAAVLDQHQQFRNVRGIRQMLHENLLQPAAERPPPLYASPAWRANLRTLAPRGLSFDLQVFPEQMLDARAFCTENPALNVALCHTGMPARQDADGLAAWRNGLRTLAALPNLHIKISGLGMFDRNWTAQSIRPLVLDAIDIFGPSRSMFASNFPVDGMMGGYQALWQAYDEITSGFSDTERADLFSGTARRFYKI